jgi:hypothetical protein
MRIMPSLTHRRDPDARHECWRVYYGDINVGTIGLRAGVPINVDQWSWSCGFFPLSHRGRRAAGTAKNFAQARADFEAAWQEYLPTCTDDDFTEHRRERAWTRWKYAMWEAGCKMPTQVPELRSRCFCGVEISVACGEHVYASHMEAA